MKYNYGYKITFGLNEPFDINYIKKVCDQYPNSKILIEVQNTKGMTSSMIGQLNSNVLIRVAGGYDKERLEKYKGQRFGNESTEDYYYNSVIYTKNETIKILEEIERIESGLDKNWSDIEKVVYIYDRLKSGIMYDPKFEHKLSSQIRSLRGLIRKKTVCAGYALIFKEFMDRNNIECEFARGGTENGKTYGHAWNIVTINGKKYPIDLTWDNARFRLGTSKSFGWLGTDVAEFSSRHYPAPGEKTQNYERTLSQINPQLIKRIYSQIGVGRARDYRSTTYYGTRKDGSRFIVAQIGDNKINNTSYYRYYYVEISKDGKKQLPLILYSETNVARLVTCKNFGKPVPTNYEETVDSILFSKENIADSIAKRTYFIGKVRKSGIGNKLELVSSYQEIAKPEAKRNLFVYPTRRFTRRDGSVFLAQQMYDKPRNVNGVNVMQYDILEMVNENGEEVLKRNTIFTEGKLLEDNRQSTADYFLSRERLDKSLSQSGGYMGLYNRDGNITYNKNLVDYYRISKNINITSAEQHNSQVNINRNKMPTFNELKELATKYEIFSDSNNMFDSSTYKIRDIQTGQIQTDSSIIDKAMFANIWLASAGIKRYLNESRPGEKTAFNEPAEKLYNIICSELSTSCMDKGVIDTVGLFRNIENISSYSHSSEIVANLFRSPYQAELINNMFLKSLSINKQSQAQKPTPLYTLEYASRLARHSDTGNVISVA